MVVVKEEEEDIVVVVVAIVRFLIVCTGNCLNILRVEYVRFCCACGELLVLLVVGVVADFILVFKISSDKVNTLRRKKI